MCKEIKMLEINESIPSFELPATQCGTLKSQDLKGKYSVVYFYPKDNTPGCTTETTDFTNLYPEFQKLNCEVIGFNHNPMKSHEKFETKLGIPFPLVSDEEQKTVEEFGVWQLKKFMGREFMGIVRTTFVFDPEGKLIKRYDKVKVKEHAQKVLEDLKELQV